MSVRTNSVGKDLMPVIYIPHGGGPMPLLGDPGHKELIYFLKELPNILPKPTAIVMISAHWESEIASISSGSQPHMIYDYGGFPAESYEYHYPAAGNPDLAEKIATLVSQQGIECRLDPLRGYDHGTFVPLMLMYANADIPVVQVSLLQSFDPAQHIALGQALAPLREQGVLIIGSGMSFHYSQGSEEDNQQFDDWLCHTLVNSTSQEVTQQLINWEAAPAARNNHRREEHLLPLHVCWGAVSRQHRLAEKVFSGLLFNRRISGFLWH
ncbi:dioxygenase [Alteromonas stellipolaris]|uniref:DODA-type extradiol aromatic ring-opening family dioxygenase n=1 Tax=Alteromonas stellipolaris TaxID=233316 RepID=UPI00077065FF|nr:class III extradiol ring-cleavage dioxygenase [Alteromonas stellipolaris]AMJ94386.1 dioxygenase [Alteromonas stellipolaris]